MKNHHLPLLFTTMVALFLFGCKTIEEVPTGNSLVEFTVEQSGALFVNEDAEFSSGLVILRSEEALKKMVERMNKNQEIVALPNVNFEQEMVVVIFDQVRSTAGHSIAVTLMNETDDRITIHVKHTPPTGIAAEVITQPFTIISTGKSDQLISLSLDGN